jgi:hypothetical protein
MQSRSSTRVLSRGPYVRMSVRGLMALVLIVGGGLGWIVHEAQVQRNAVAAVKKAGGSVVYDWQRTLGAWEPRPWGPKWLVDRIGVDYFGNVVEVWLSGPTLQDAEAALAHVGNLRRLEGLWLAAPAMTDDGMAHLAGLTKLKLLNIDLSGTAVTDAGLVHLKGLTGLERLGLTRTSVTIAGVSELQETLPKVWIVR